MGDGIKRMYEDMAEEEERRAREASKNTNSASSSSGLDLVATGEDVVSTCESKLMESRVGNISMGQTKKTVSQRQGLDRPKQWNGRRNHTEQYASNLSERS